MATRPRKPIHAFGTAKVNERARLRTTSFGHLGSQKHATVAGSAIGSDSSGPAPSNSLRPWKKPSLMLVGASVWLTLSGTKTG